MISITPVAQEKLSHYLSENKVSPQVRIYLPECSCGGSTPQLSLALDSPNPGDVTLEKGDLSLFMSRDLFETVGKVTIDFKEENNDSGFVIFSEHPVPLMERECGPSCNCCG